MTITRINVNLLIDNFYPGSAYAVNDYFLTRDLINKNPTIDLHKLKKQINRNKNLSLPKTQIKTINKYINGIRPRNLSCLDEFIRNCTKTIFQEFNETPLTDKQLKSTIETGYITLEGNLFRIMYDNAKKDQKTFGIRNEITLTMKEEYLSLTFELIKSTYRLNEESVTLAPPNIIINNYLITRGLYAYHQQLTNESTLIRPSFLQADSYL